LDLSDRAYHWRNACGGRMPMCARKRLLLGYAGRESFLTSEKETYEKESLVHLRPQQCAQPNG
jgi:hypothetical protein